MVKLNNLIIFVVFLIILCASLAVFFLYKSDVDIIKQTRHYPNKTLIFDDYSFKDDRLVYLVCDKGVTSMCKVVQEKFPYKSAHRSCNVTLDVKGRLREQSIVVAAFGVNNTILLWEDDRSKLGDQTYVRLSIVDLNFCNKTKIHEYDTFSTKELRNTKTLLPYRHTFDVFYKNYTQCIYNECQLAIGNWDGQGTIFHRVKFHMPNLSSNISDIHTMKNDVPDHGIVYLRTFDEHTDLWLNPNNYTDSYNSNEDILLKKFTGEIKVSVVDESIGACSREDINSNITCWQFYPNGTERLNVTLNDINNITHLHNIYTLPDGGFLLSFIDFGRCQEDVCNPDLLSNYFVMKIDAERKEVGKLRFHGLEKDCTGIQHAHIYQKSKKEQSYCIFVVPAQKQSDKFDILVNCFPISNFAA